MTVPLHLNSGAEYLFKHEFVQNHEQEEDVSVDVVVPFSTI